MSVLKIKSDLNRLTSEISRTIGTVDSLSSNVNGMGYNVTKSTLSRVQNECNKTVQQINRLNTINTDVAFQCANELEIFFKAYNTECKQQVTENDSMIEEIITLYNACEMCYEFLDISEELEWLMYCGITPDLFNWIVPRIQTYKMQLQALQYHTMNSNQKLILKAR